MVPFSIRKWEILYAKGLKFNHVHCRFAQRLIFYITSQWRRKNLNLSHHSVLICCRKKSTLHISHFKSKKPIKFITKTIDSTISPKTTKLQIVKEGIYVTNFRNMQVFSIWQAKGLSHKSGSSPLSITLQQAWAHSPGSGAHSRPQVPSGALRAAGQGQSSAVLRQRLISDPVFSANTS